MTQTIASQIEALLIQAEQAHGEYERSILNGIYDQNWANWYAQFAIDHGIEQLIGKLPAITPLSQFLSQSYEQYKADSSQQTWAAYTAERLAQFPGQQ